MIYISVVYCSGFTLFCSSTMFIILFYDKWHLFRSLLLVPLIFIVYKYIVTIYTYFYINTCIHIEYTFVLTYTCKQVYIFLFLKKTFVSANKRTCCFYCLFLCYNYKKKGIKKLAQLQQQQKFKYYKIPSILCLA